MGLSVEQSTFVELRVANEKKSIVVAYLLWLFLGLLGVHRFYLGKTGTAVAMLLLSLSIVGLIVSVLWTLIDLFLVPGIIKEADEVLRNRLRIEALVNQNDSDGNR